jgi:signal transduction histidine kinase
LTLDHREVSFAEIVQNVVEQFLPAAEGKGVRLDVEAPDALPLLCSDEQRLGQVLRNLVDNAIKFTPAGGVVRVHAETQEGTLLCEVEDTGIGIEHEDAVRLFQVFGQLDPSATRLRGGLGLGLALVRELVTLMGGEVGVRSTVREGSTFWFKLPLRHAPPTDAAVEIRKHVY